MSARLDIDELNYNELGFTFKSLRRIFIMLNIIEEDYVLIMTRHLLFNRNGYKLCSDMVEFNKIMIMIKLFYKTDKWTTNDVTIAGKVSVILCALAIMNENKIVENMGEAMDGMLDDVINNEINESEYKDFCDAFMRFKNFITDIKRYPVVNKHRIYKVPLFEWFEYENEKHIKLIFLEDYMDGNIPEEDIESDDESDDESNDDIANEV